MMSTRILGLFIALTVPQVSLSLDIIPEDISSWTEEGVVLDADTSIQWENKDNLYLSGIAKVNGTYYLFYQAGFDGCWDSDSDVNHKSVGLATSTDGIHFTRYPGNPILKPHDFVPVQSEEEGIRNAYIQYLPSKGKFYAYLGVESPGGLDNCPFGGGGSCECNVEVDAAPYLATSEDGRHWEVEGAVDGAYASVGSEVYSSGWVFNGSDFGVYVTTAQGGYVKSASRGPDPLSLNELGQVSSLDWGWSGLDAYLHDDNNTITLIYDPQGGGHPGANNDYLYFSTTHLDDMKNIQNERIVARNGNIGKQNSLLKDQNEWRWYYRFNYNIMLRTHPLDGQGDPPRSPFPPSPPTGVQVLP